MDMVEVFQYLIKMVAMLIPILVGFAIVAFFWGIVKFIAHADDERAIAEGKLFIVWGLVGLFVLVSFWALVGYIQETIGVEEALSLGNLSQQKTEIPVPD